MTDDHHDVAHDILERALDEAMAAGVDGPTFLHSAVGMALGMMPAFTCRSCLERELDHMRVAVAERIEDIPETEVAMSCGHLH